jgi:methionine-rich copper-binding protein CopC
MRRNAAAALAAVSIAVFGGSSIASAHASLTRCSIKNNAVFTVKTAPRLITAFFAEPLDPARSWINVFEGQADHGLVNDSTKSQVVGPQELMLRLPKLLKEKYYVIWYTHSAKDGHFAAGIVYFTVK